MAALRLHESDEDAILPVSVGTAIWSALLVILLLNRAALADHGTSWWIAAAAVGVVSGLGGVVFLTWRKRRAMRRVPQG